MGVARIDPGRMVCTDSPRRLIPAGADTNPNPRLASQASPFSLISRINTVGEKGLVLERSVIGHVMPGLVGVVDRVVGAVDHMTDNICMMEPFPARASLIR